MHSIAHFQENMEEQNFSKKHGFFRKATWKSKAINVITVYAQITRVKMEGKEEVKRSNCEKYIIKNSNTENQGKISKNTEIEL